MAVLAVAVPAVTVRGWLRYRIVAVVANNDRYCSRSVVYGLRRLQRSSFAK